MNVVDYDRMRRLQLPEEDGPSLMTKVYGVVIIIVILLLIKRYKDTARSRFSTISSEIEFPEPLAWSQK